MSVFLAPTSFFLNSRCNASRINVMVMVLKLRAIGKVRYQPRGGKEVDVCYLRILDPALRNLNDTHNLPYRCLITCIDLK